jgi:glycosyltransferase involved in cell wall biosynthesis
MTTILHLTSSRLFGGPERQMLGLGAALPLEYRSIFASFWEEGNCLPFINEARRRGFQTHQIQGSRFRPLAALKGVKTALERFGADVLFCHGYKADTLGLWAARRHGIPVIGVSRGWTGESMRVRLYEALDRRVLRCMDHVVCVSEGQRAKVLRAGVAPEKTSVIHNAIQVTDEEPDERYRRLLKEMFAAPPKQLVLAAGRLSPEKGFGVLLDAAHTVLDRDPGVGFVLFGDGALRPTLEKQIAAHGMTGRFVMAGFRNDLSRFLPNADIVVLPSFTEGLPNVALEACAAGKPVVATRVGGTPEVIVDGLNGFLVPPGDPVRLARAILKLLRSRSARRAMGEHGLARVRSAFTFDGQSWLYRDLLSRLGCRNAAKLCPACKAA